LLELYEQGKLRKEDLTPEVLIEFNKYE